MTLKLHPRALAFVVGLLLAGCGGVPTKPAPAPEPPRTAATLWTVEEARANFDAGLKSVAASLTKQQDASTARAREAYAFRVNRVRWATLEGDVVISLESGSKSDGWLVLVPPNHPYTKTQRNVFQTEARNPLAVVRIRPERIATPWTGVFAMHEVSHLMDRVTGVEPMGAPDIEFLRGEIRAVRIEMEIVDAMTEGGFGKTLDSLIDGYRVTDAKQCFEHGQGLKDDAYRALDQTMGAVAAESEADIGLRGGMFATSLFVRCIDRQGYGERRMLQGFEAWHTAEGRWDGNAFSGEGK